MLFSPPMKPPLAAAVTDTLPIDDHPGTANIMIVETMERIILIPKKDTTAPRILCVLNRLPRHMENSTNVV